MEYQWPWNLTAEINKQMQKAGVIEISLPVRASDAPDDFMGTLYYLLYTLPSERKREVMLDYYQSYNTLESIAQKHFVTRERVRQLIESGVKSLAAGSHMLQMGLQRTHERDTQTAVKRAIEKQMQAVARERSITQNSQTENPLADLHRNATPIEALMLSTRAYNCLKRRGLKSVGDILRLSRADFLAIRNLGAATAAEILRKLEALGCDVDHLMLY